MKTLDRASPVAAMLEEASMLYAIQDRTAATPRRIAMLREVHGDAAGMLLFVPSPGHLWNAAGSYIMAA